MPDSISGPYVGSTRRELVALIRDQIAYLDFPASAIRDAKVNRTWAFIKRHGSSSAHFSIQYRGYEIAFHGLTEAECAEMERENA